MGKPLRVLIVEDSRADADLLLEELRRGGREPIFQRVETAEAMNEALDRQSWDIVLSDYVMPRFDGLAALELLKVKGIDTPFIIVSGVIGEDVAVKAMKAGAGDYVIKGNLTRLVPAVERELREAEVRRERRKAEEERDRLMEQLRNVNEQLVLSSMRDDEQASELEAVISAIAEAVVVYGPAGGIIHINPAAADLLDYSSASRKETIFEQLARLPLETRDGERFQIEDSPTSRALRGETVRGVVAIIRPGPGSKPLWVSMSAAPIRSPKGNTGGGVTIFTDVTALCEEQHPAESRE
ncbi:MAG: response regulator [Chloroflexi bacterium]|nr:response regulator [Chloroflexota bacterium]